MAANRIELFEREIQGWADAVARDVHSDQRAVRKDKTWWQGWTLLAPTAVAAAVAIGIALSVTGPQPAPHAPVAQDSLFGSQFGDVAHNAVELPTPDRVFTAGFETEELS